jgi:hypothetical protein
VGNACKPGSPEEWFATPTNPWLGAKIVKAPTLPMLVPADQVTVQPLPDFEPFKVPVLKLVYTPSNK